MKRLIAIFLICLTLFSFAGLSAFAAGTGAISVSSETAHPGATVTVQVAVTENPGVMYLSLSPAYDTSKLELIEMSKLASGWDVQAIANWLGDNDETFTGNVLSLTFKVKDGAIGTASVSMRVEEAYNYNEDSVSFSVTPGSITIAHTLTKTDAVAANCEAAGNSAYYTCSDCGKYFSDEAGTAEIAENSWVIPALGHKPGEAVRENEKAATCTEEGSYDEVVRCSVCQKELSRETKTITALGHEWGDWIVDSKPTCTADGVENRICKHATTHIETRSIPATGHDWGAVTYTWADDNSTVTATRTCANDASHVETETVSTTYAVTTAATCEVAGVGTYSAAFTNTAFAAQSKAAEIPALDHDWGEWTVTTPATEEAEGEETRTCQRDASHTETRAVPKLNHVHKLVKTEAAAARCETAGNIEYYRCSVCGKLFSDAEGAQEITQTDTVVAALGHDWGEWTVTAPTCTKNGSRTRTCNRDSSHVETETIPALGHKPGEAVRENEKAATCTENGCYDEVVRCSVCNAELSRETKTVAALDHDWGEWIVTKESTCSEEGVQTRTCKRDSTHTDTQSLAKVGHTTDSGTVTKAPTCTEKGVKTYTCLVCKEVLTTEEIPALDHDWGEWAETAPTCTENGSRTRTCNRDSAHVETETIPATGHAWGEPTYTWADDNSTVTATRTCANDASHVETETVNTSYSVTTAATCDAAGVGTYTAAFTNTAFAAQSKTAAIPATGHALSKVEAVAASCEAAGNSEYYSCSVCNKLFRDAEGTQEITQEDTIVAALGHDWGEWSVTAAPTCTTEGVQTRTCTRDGSHTETQPVAALGHDWGEWSVTTAPICTEAGEETRTCKRDGTHTETQPVAALGHDWGEWSVTTAPTCTEAGEETRTCKRDGTHTETQPVAALGHDWGEGTVTKEPSCTEKGESVYTCSACKETKTEELAALGHQSDAGTVTKAATCTEPGIKTYTCTVCGEVVRTETLPALAHTWDAGTVTKAATCTDAGVMTNTCTVCGAKRTTEIPARGHSYENGVCKTCGARQLDFTPRIIEGNGGTAHYGSDYPLKSNAPFSTFLTVYVDGVELSPANYTLMEGSTIVTLKASYIQWLDEGWHSIRIASTLGNADGTFSVSRSPKTGDQDLARLALLLTLGGCGTVMAATLVRKKVRSK